MKPSTKPKGWYSRGYLPHLDVPDLLQSITFRDDAHLQGVIAYIENNPVKAGLVANAHDWPFGSACRRSGGDA